MIVGKIIDYNPEDDTINIIFNNSKLLFNINHYNDPFNNSFHYKQYVFAYRNTTLSKGNWTYKILLKNEAIALLESNIKHPSMYVFEGHVLFRECYIKYRTKSKFFTHLLNELKDESN